MYYDVCYVGHWKKLPPPPGTELIVKIGNAFEEGFSSLGEVLTFLYGEKFFLENAAKWREYSLDFSSPIRVEKKKETDYSPSENFRKEFLGGKKKALEESLVEILGKRKVKTWAKDIQPLYIAHLPQRYSSLLRVIARLEKLLNRNDYRYIEKLLRDRAEERRWMFSQDIFVGITVRNPKELKR